MDSFNIQLAYSLALDSLSGAQMENGQHISMDNRGVDFTIILDIIYSPVLFFCEVG